MDAPATIDSDGVGEGLTFVAKYGFTYITCLKETKDVVPSDGVNSAGLSFAALYFPGHASPMPSQVPENRRRVAMPSTALGAWILASFASVDVSLFFQTTEVEEAVLMSSVEPWGRPYKPHQDIGSPEPPCHVSIRDQHGGHIVIESVPLTSSDRVMLTADGTSFADSTVLQRGYRVNVYKGNGVLTNSPDYQSQLHMARYLTSQLSTHLSTPVSSEGPFGVGYAAVGLPGDLSSSSRFVRTTFGLKHLQCTQENALSRMATLVDGVAFPYGMVRVERLPDHVVTNQMTVLKTLGDDAFFVKCTNDYASASWIKVPLEPIVGPVEQTTGNAPLPFISLQDMCARMPASTPLAELLAKTF
ncbi:MAG: hypothetical protein MHM6MM_006168 [Cercozoa sp. M6MM]